MEFKITMFGTGLSTDFLTALASIVLIDLMLSGDNAVIIAMAVKNLPKQNRSWAIFLGTTGAIAVRVFCTFIISTLLMIQFVKLIGGVFILWIAVKLLIDNQDEAGKSQSSGLWQAVWFIVLADTSMGSDNMLAVAGAAKGNLYLVLFGLALSIPFIILTSSWLVGLMDRFPLILYLGAAVLGKIGGEMIVTDPFVQNMIHPGKGVVFGFMGLSTVVVVVTGKFLPEVLSKEGKY
jgi:YjbE family integral membrane protein